MKNFRKLRVCLYLIGLSFCLMYFSLTGFFTVTAKLANGDVSHTVNLDMVNFTKLLPAAPLLLGLIYDVSSRYEEK